MAERVLITGARAAAALDLARDFAAAGWEVHLADSTRARIARWSSNPHKVHAYPSPALKPAEFRQAIAQLMQQIEPALVVPVCEEVFHLASPALAECLEARLFAPPLRTLRRLHDKLTFAQACTDWGLAVPETHALEKASDAERFASQSQEWVFKSRYSRFGETVLIGPTARQLRAAAPGTHGLWLAQRRIRGTEACFYAVAREGNLTGFCAYRSDWRLGGGASFVFDPLGRNQAAKLQQIAARLAQRTSITGQFACDAIFDRDGKPWLIECNPRSTSGVHLLTGEGHLARAMTQDSAQASTMAERMTKGPAYLGPAMAFFGLPLAIRQGRIADWRAMLASGRDVISCAGDRMPLAGAMVDAASYAMHGWRHGISTSAATTRDMEWNGEELA